MITCKRLGVEPYAYLHDILRRLPGHPNNDIWQLTPRGWKETFAAKSPRPVPAYVIQENVVTLVPTAHDVIHRSRILHSQLPQHVGSYGKTEGFSQDTIKGLRDFSTA